jgi:ATP-dependent DNA ligase
VGSGARFSRFCFSARIQSVPLPNLPIWSTIAASNDAWRYIGHVGTGFSHKTLEEERDRTAAG